MISAAIRREVSRGAASWRSVGLWAAAHMVDDLFLSLVPCAIPFFVIDRHFSYVDASGLVLAAALGSALPQLGIGLVVDRFSVRWLPAVGLVVAGLGFGLAGLAHSRSCAYLCIAVSGLGVAIFHPAAGKAVRIESRGSVTGMAIFAAGGSFGGLIAPILATPVFVGLGLNASPLFIAPAVFMATVLLVRRRRPLASQIDASAPVQISSPRPFTVLVGVEVVRACVATGVTTFIALYWVRHLHASTELGEAALLLELAGGVLGTIVGGYLAQRVGTVRTIQIGNILLIPGVAGLLFCDNENLGLLIAFALGIVVTIPFAVLVKLGQDYLPTRPGTAAGVTYGLSVSAGGLLMPVLGLLAESDGLRAVLAVLAVIPIISVALSTGLHDPAARVADRGDP